MASKAQVAEALEEIQQAVDEGDYELALQHTSTLQSMLEKLQEEGDQ